MTGKVATTAGVLPEVRYASRLYVGVQNGIAANKKLVDVIEEQGKEVVSRAFSHMTESRTQDSVDPVHPQYCREAIRCRRTKLLQGYRLGAQEVMMARIVLAHGILGLGDIVPLQPLHYFNGIKPLYERAGHQVSCPNVAALGSLEKRAERLTEHVRALLQGDEQPIYMIAHSMGGLDCRLMLARNPAIAKRVRRLITVATPHYGSRVADAILSPGVLNPARVLTQYFRDEIGAIDDLTTGRALKDAPFGGVQSLCVGCDGGPPHRSPLFALTATLGGFGATRNDGVVSVASASLSGVASDLSMVWPVDHGEAIGWPSVYAAAKQAAISPPPGHIARYLALLDKLLAQ